MEWKIEDDNARGLWHKWRRNPEYWFFTWHNEVHHKKSRRNTDAFNHKMRRVKIIKMGEVKKKIKICRN